jgi:hypothetical protein
LASCRSIVSRASLVGELESLRQHRTQVTPHALQPRDVRALRARQPLTLPARELAVIDIASLQALAVHAFDPRDRGVIKHMRLGRASSSVA